MIENAKIQFSAEELELLKNREWILTKNRIIEKISAGFELLAMRLRNEMIAFYPFTAKQVAESGFKVSRGEKYKGLPYLMLDFPRIFGKENILAIRVLFWWGQYYSITLHAKGHYANSLNHVLENLKTEGNELFVSFSGDEWNHDLNDMDYERMAEYSLPVLKSKTREAAFFKLVKRVDLKQWEDAEQELSAAYYQFLALIEISCQYDEKGL